MMRVLVILVLLVAIAIGLGWIVISKSGDSGVNIKVNTEEVKKDTERLVEGTKKALEPKHESNETAPANP